MNQIPAGWYADPEYAGSDRYWDGTAWTDQRRPTAPPKSTKSAWGIFTDTFELLWRAKEAVAGVLLPLVLLSLIGVFAVFAAVDQMLDPDLGVILDRVSEPAFDPNDTADRAFLDSITFDVNGSTIGWFAVALAVTFIGQMLPPVLLGRAGALTHFDRPVAQGDIWREALRRAPRVLGLSLMVLLALGLIIGVAFVLAWILPLTLLLTVPAMVVLSIWQWPIIAMATQIIAVGPVGVPAYRTAFARAQGRWWGLFGRLLIVAIAALCVGIPFSALSQAVGLTGAGIVSAFGQALQAATTAMGSLFVYLWLGGPIDPTITDRTGSGLGGPDQPV